MIMAKIVLWILLVLSVVSLIKLIREFDTKISIRVGKGIKERESIAKKLIDIGLQILFVILITLALFSLKCACWLHENGSNAFKRSTPRCKWQLTAANGVFTMICDVCGGYVYPINSTTSVCWKCEKKFIKE